MQQEGSSAVLQLQLEGETQAVIIQELQRDPVKGQILHVDFKAIRMDEPVEKEVPLKLEGEAPGEKAGGVLQQQLRYVEIRCLPSQLPGEISVDVSNLEIGDVLTLAEVPFPKGLSFSSDPEIRWLSASWSRNWVQRKRRAKERMKPPVRKKENEKALRAVQSPPGVSFLIGRGRNFGCALLFSWESRWAAGGFAA